MNRVGKEVLEDHRWAWYHRYPQLASIEDDSWLSAIPELEPVSMPAGETVFLAGDPSRQFLLCLSGTIRVYATGRGGREIVLYRMRPGEVCYLTLTTLMHGGVYPAHAVTEDDVHALSLAPESFNRVFGNSPEFRSYMLEQLAGRLHDTIRHFQELAFEPLEVRLAALLYRRFREEECLTIHITHNQLAQELGTTREVASRMLKCLEHQDCVKLYRGRIELLGGEALSRLSEIGN